MTNLKIALLITLVSAGALALMYLTLSCGNYQG
jgi:hypothetical protein